MLLVSFLLWLCGIFCDLCAVTAFATICLTAVGDTHCCRGSVFGGEKATAFSGVPPVVFFYMTLHFYSHHFPSSFLSLLATSVAAVYNYTRHREKGRR